MESNWRPSALAEWLSTAKSLPGEEGGHIQPQRKPHVATVQARGKRLPQPPSSPGLLTGRSPRRTTDSQGAWELFPTKSRHEHFLIPNPQPLAVSGTILPSTLREWMKAHSYWSTLVLGSHMQSWMPCRIHSYLSSYFFLISLVRTSRTMLNSSTERKACLVSYFNEMFVIFQH